MILLIEKKRMFTNLPQEREYDDYYETCVLKSICEIIQANKNFHNLETVGVLF